MANRIVAINTYRPKIDLGLTIKVDQLVQYIADRTGLNRGDIRHMLDEFQDSIVFFALNGQGVKLEGLGTFKPTMDTQGKLRLSTRIDNKINNRLNQKGAFKGEILKRENIGKTTDELVALWNQEHSDDPVS